MPYCKQWRAAMFPDYRDQGAYIDYKGIKDILHRMKGNIVNASSPDELFTELRAQKKKTYDWCTSKLNEIEKLAKATEMCSRRFDDSIEHANSSFAAESFDHRDALPVESVKSAADAILYESLRFHECRNLNTDTIEHIVHRQFRYTPLQPSGKWIKLLEDYDFNLLSLDVVFYLLSVVYERVKQAVEGSQGVQKISSGDVGSQVFDRRSVKYWVHKQDLPFVIARIIQNLPYSSIKDTYKECEDAGHPFTLGQRINSVYYDNNDFLFYHRRLERLETCSLIRFRWYTDTLESDINALTPNSDVFVEMKVHHEAWSGERSTKQRFALKEKDLDSFIHGTLSPEHAIEKMLKKNTSTKDIENFKDLYRDIVDKITTYNMKPVLRTQCTRGAFQRGNNQTVRVSIDNGVRMCSEDFGISNHWRHESSEPLSATNFPYCIVELKLQYAENERLPPWVEELMKCRHMESVPKFSKYGHGVAALFSHTDKIKIVPYWLHQVNADIRAAFKPDNDNWDPTVGLANTWFHRLADRILLGTELPQTNTIGASEVFLLEGNNHGRVYNQMLNGAKSAKDSKTYELDRRHVAFLSRIRSNYVESICFPGYGKMGKTLAGGIPWQTGKRVMVPQKFDPKTLFASERYMLKWIRHATHLGLAGLVSINFGNGNALPSLKKGKGVFNYIFSSEFHIHIGILLVACSVSVCIYALVMHGVRSRRVYARQKIRYDDTLGPTVLTFVLILSLFLIGFNMITARFAPMLSGSDFV
eukprot:Tbor_TRINITY_DN3821_c0_g1::TRINITY_DN3821_c0_g1_i1::g.5703::m.5703